MSYRFTKSTNGRRFRLMHTSRHPRPIESYVEVQYKTAPEFEDQVFGDLERKMRAEHPRLGFGLRLIKAVVDPALDEVAEHARPGSLAGTRAVPVAEQSALVHTDARGRVYLGKHLQPNRDYRVSKLPDGTVVFEPVTAFTDQELAALREAGK